jgi:hypothetical protein
MSSESATKSRETKRAAQTQELMSNIMTGGEISKKREAELAAAADRGRGIQFVESTGTVKGLTRIDPATGKKVSVKKTGAKATDYTGRIISSAPTFGELGKDMARAVFGGQAKDPEYLRSGVESKPGYLGEAPRKTTDYMQYTPKPRKVKGIVPAMIEKGGTPVGMAMKAILGKEDVKKKLTAQQKYDQGVQTYSTLLGGDRTKKGGLLK